MSGWDVGSGRWVLRHHATSHDIMRSGAGGIRRHSTEGVAEERRGGGSGSGGQTGVRSGRRAGVGSVRGSPYRLLDFQADQVCVAKISMVQQAHWTWHSATKPNIDFPGQRLSPELPVVPRNSLNSIDNSFSAIDFVFWAPYGPQDSQSAPEIYSLVEPFSCMKLAFMLDVIQLCHCCRHFLSAQLNSCFTLGTLNVS